jgi:STE24 endopeptidase
MRMAMRLATVATAVGVWVGCAWLLWRTSVPSLHLSGLNATQYFPARVLRRSEQFTRGEDLLWLLATIANLAALAVLAWRLPRSVRTIGLGRIGSAIIVALVVLVTEWFVQLPFSVASLWWQHHYGLGPFDIGAWLGGQWGALLGESGSLLLGITLIVGLAGRFRRWWWLPAGATIVAVAALFAFTGGWLGSTGTHPLYNAKYQADVTRLERAEHVQGTPVVVQDVTSFTNQVNAFTVGFGPSRHVVLWNTLFDGRLSHASVDVVIAHELGHVRSGHIKKAIGWSALSAFPVLFLVAWLLRRRGGLADPANVPLAFLALAVIVLLTTPLQNAVSRRDEAEADWRALNATHDPVAAELLFQAFAKTSLEQPDPPVWNYLWLENHPTLAQRVAMVNAWEARNP